MKAAHFVCHATVMDVDDVKTPLWKRRHPIPRYWSWKAVSLEGAELPEVNERVWWRARVMCHLGTGETLVLDDGEAKFGRTFGRGLDYPKEYRVASWVIPPDLRIVGSRFYISPPWTHEKWEQISAENFQTQRRLLWDLLRLESVRIVAQGEQNS